MRKLLIVMGVPVDNLTMEEALERIDEFVRLGRATGKTHQVATINADFVVNSLHDPELRRILQESDMTTADGMPLVWGARLLGVPLSGRVTGADMVPALAAHAAQRGYSLYFLGARPGIAARAADILQQRYPGLQVAGVFSPPNASVLEMDRAVMEQVRAARPDIVLVAFGNPKQEKWISMYARELQAPVCIGVGGTLDMIAGVTKRAPRWMQKAGLEWSYRLLQEPRRLLKRYVYDMVYFSYFFARQWWEMRRGGGPLLQPPAVDPPSPPPPPSLTVQEDTTVMAIRGRLDIGNQEAFVAQAIQALDRSPFLIISLAEAEFLDSSALGTLVNLYNRARAAGGNLWLVEVPPKILQLLALVHLDRFFEILPDATEVTRHRDLLVRPVAPEPGPIGWQVIKTPRLLDTGAAPAMLEKGQQALTIGSRLILDFSETMFLASAGMAVLIKLDRQAREQGGELRIVGCSHDVLRSLQLVKLDTILRLFPDMAAAAELEVVQRDPAPAGTLTLPLAHK